MSETPGGLVKASMQFSREQWAWLQQRAVRKGGASIAAIVREIVQDAMNAEYRATRADVDTEQ